MPPLSRTLLARPDAVRQVDVVKAAVPIRVPDLVARGHVRERAAQLAAAVQDDVVAGLLFQLGDLFGDVLPDDRGVVPFSGSQCCEDDVLRHTVHAVGEALVFGAVGQNALNISYVTRPSSIAPDANASSILYRCWSSPRTPTPTRSSRRRAARGRCLHHAVERDELGRDQSSHDILFTLRRTPSAPVR